MPTLLTGSYSDARLTAPAMYKGRDLCKITAPEFEKSAALRAG